jgi:ribosomal subunit interface protein
MSASDSLRKLVDEKIDKIIARFPDAGDFRVVVDCGAAVKRRKGSTCLVRVELTVATPPGRIESEVKHESAYTGVREVFQNLTRQIEHRVDSHARVTSTVAPPIAADGGDRMSPETSWRQNRA